MKVSLAIVLLVVCQSAFGQQKVELIKLDELQRIVEESSEELKVINFWASWCGPCVKEMPYFDAANARDDVSVYFVSLDFPQDLAKAEKLVNKKGIKSTTFLLDEKNYDEYITSIDSDWSGAIPATLFIDENGNKSFYEKSFEEKELNAVIDKLTSK